MAGDLVRVGRWMCQREYELMVSTGYVQESTSGTTHVAWPADPDAFILQADDGSLYVEFDVPLDSVRPTQPGWAKILGPRTLEARLAAKKGLALPAMPPAANIVHVATK
jgi:hypothetical protein